MARSHNALARKSAAFISLILYTIILVGPPSPAFARFHFPQLRAAAGSCTQLNEVVNSDQDARAALQSCIDRTPAGGTLALAPGRYIFGSPISVSKPISLTTAGVSAAALPCMPVDPRCAMILNRTAPRGAVPGKPTPMPVALAADNVAVDHIIFAGYRVSDASGAVGVCQSKPIRALGGGLRVSGNGIQITNSVFKNFSCYSAFEYLGGSGLIVRNNTFLRNGTHNNHMWADGLTIHDGSGMVIENNRFIDNTDVQLILGGCKGCKIANNTFLHRSGSDGGSFADLMLQAWPRNTSGRYDNTVVNGNTIDCGPSRSCGFGLMVGSLPWYNAPVSGGEVTGNVVKNAQLGMNVEGLSGPMNIHANRIQTTTGTSAANCGQRSIQKGINVAPASRQFLSAKSSQDQDMKDASTDSFANCILNYPKS